MKEKKKGKKLIKGEKNSRVKKRVKKRNNGEKKRKKDKKQLYFYLPAGENT